MATTYEQAMAAKNRAVKEVKLAYHTGVVNSVGVGYDDSDWVVVVGIAPNAPTEIVPDTIGGVRTKVEFQGPAVAAEVLDELDETALSSRTQSS